MQSLTCFSDQPKGGNLPPFLYTFPSQLFIMKFFQLFILSTNTLGEHGVDHEVCRSEDFAIKKGQRIYNCNDNVTGYVVVEIKDNNRRITYKAVEESVLHLYNFGGERVVLAN